MKLLVLESSDNKNGSSNMFAREFIRGVKESRKFKSIGESRLNKIMAIIKQNFIC